MDDEIRTAIQNFLEGYCDVPQTYSECKAEDLYEYLKERGYDITE